MIEAQVRQEQIMHELVFQTHFTKQVNKLRSKNKAVMMQVCING